MKFSYYRGFTLIELLIVVAIIAILAAIAIPNFLAAQVRSKVSRTKADMRSVSTALESYYVDNNTYPLMRGSVVGGIIKTRGEDIDGYGDNCSNAFRTLPIEITTPIAYITREGLKPDPFKNPGIHSNTGKTFVTSNTLDRTYLYTNIQEFVDSVVNGFNNDDIIAYGLWRIASIGPDGKMINTVARTIYDPTNGLVSNGEILRTQKSAAGERNDPTSGTD